MREPAAVEATDPSLDEFFATGWNVPEEITSAVRDILCEVRARGDTAIVEYTRRFDDPDFDLDALPVPIPRLDDARRLVPPEIVCALELARERIKRFHAHQRSADIAYEERDGTRYAYLTRPLGAIAAYVPGGSAPLPSTVLMSIVPARLAGVTRTVLLTPRRNERVDPAILFAAALCGADELYAVGGAQAIAAAAYGTASIAPVEKIVGPGNVWVTEAKRQVAGACGIDGLAGPSEVLVVADDGASPVLVAGELLAQAEHDPLARVAAISESSGLLDAIGAELVNALRAGIARTEIVREVLARRCRLIHVADFAQLCETIDRFAPEHLSLRVADPDRLLARVRSAGAVFIGESTPVACGDYLAGTNHVLPTSGSARFSTGLSLSDFTRSFAVVRYSDERIRADAPAIAALASFEGLEQHARAARMAAERLT